MDFAEIESIALITIPITSKATRSISFGRVSTTTIPEGSKSQPLRSRGNKANHESFVVRARGGKILLYASVSAFGANGDFYEVSSTLFEIAVQENLNV